MGWFFNEKKAPKSQQNVWFPSWKSPFQQTYIFQFAISIPGGSWDAFETNRESKPNQPTPKKTKQKQQKKTKQNNTTKADQSKTNQPKQTKKTNQTNPHKTKKTKTKQHKTNRNKQHNTSSVCDLCGHVMEKISGETLSYFMKNILFGVDSLYFLSTCLKDVNMRSQYYTSLNSPRSMKKNPQIKSRFQTDGLRFLNSEILW